MRRLLARFRKEDGGFTLVWLASVLVLLIGMTGFGTDLGWLYLNTVRTQSAVDAAALAGVVNLPGFNPVPDAEDAARANGYDPGGADVLTVTPIDDNELEATLQTQVDTFFLGVLGFNQFTVTRRATAQYVKPVPLGSPDNCFGAGPGTSGCSGGSEDFWAAVSGRRTLVEDGDPYSTECVRNSWSSGIVCNGANSEYSRGVGGYPGYYYGVEVDVGTTNLSVDIWDRGFQQRSPIGSETGDSVFGVDGPNGTLPPIHTRYRFYPPDITPLIPDDHLSGGPTCEVEQTPGGSINTWSQLCFIANPTPGIWLVHVESINNSAGSNNYSIRANASGPTPRVYGINDMSIWSNDLSAGSELYLAEIIPDHAGKKLELQFYDAGDAFGASTYRVLNPQGVTPNCTWTVWNYNQTVEQTSLNGSGPCQWLTSIAGQNDGIYNELWIKAIIDLPTDPADMCAGTNCFWKMDLDLAQPTERTVWRARVIGNPVRLLP